MHRSEERINQEEERREEGGNKIKIKINGGDIVAKKEGRGRT